MSVKDIFIILLLSCLLFLFGLGKLDLWSPDEPRYAEVAREMVISGEYLIPHLNGKVYDRKPPMLFWVAALSFKLFGIKEWAARLPVAILGILTVVLVYFFGAFLFDFATGKFASLILATTYWFVWLGRRVKMDVPLTFFVMLSIFLFYMAYDNPSKRKIYYPLAFLFVGIGALFKGPVAFSIPFITMVLFHVYVRDFSFIKNKSFWMGIVLSVFIYISWMMLAAFKVGFGYLVDQIYTRTSALFVHTKVHKRSIFYYIIQFPLNTLPWVVFLPSALIYGLKLEKSKYKEGFMLLFFWLVGNFIFFSLAKTKRSPYLIPLYPAFSLMVALYVKDLRENAYIKYHKFITALFFIVVLALVSSLPFLKFPFKSMVMVSLPIITFSFLISVLALHKRKFLKESLMVSLFVVIIFGFNYVMPFYNPCKSVRKLCNVALNVIEKKKLPLFLVGIGNSHAGEFNFYTGIVPIPILGKKVEDIIKVADKGGLFITKGRYLKRFEGKLRIKKIYQQPCGHRFTLFFYKDGMREVNDDSTFRFEKGVERDRSRS